MAEEEVQNPLPGKEAVEQDVDQIDRDKIKDTAEKTQPDADPSPLSDGPDTKGDPSIQPNVDPKIPPNGDSSTPPKGDPSTPPKGDPSTPPKGDPSTPPNGDSSTPPKGDSSTPPNGDPNTPLKGDSSTPLKGDSSTPPNADSSTPLKGDSSTPTNGDSSTPPNADPIIPPKGDPSILPNVESKPVESKPVSSDPPIDWFEPLEEDDDDDTLMGESEKSASVAGSGKKSKKLNSQEPRIIRKRTRPDEGWEDWPALGIGWKRKEVIRRSGSSVGQTDVYYISPQGHRVRSRPGLVAVVEGKIDISRFDFKSGVFLDATNQTPKPRKRKRKVKELPLPLPSSDSSAVEEEEEEERERFKPDSSHQRLTPTPASKISPAKDNWNTKTGNAVPLIYRNDKDDKSTFPKPSSSKVLPLLSINGNLDTEKKSLICSRCGITFNGTWYDKQRKKPCCPSCWDLSKVKEHPMIRFRKWLPCGECVPCRNPNNCGQCHNCTSESQSPEPRKRICQTRRCMMPIRRNEPTSEDLPLNEPISSLPEVFDDNASVKSENTDSQHMTLKNSDTENLTYNLDPYDDEDMTTDDDDDWHKKRKRRSCGDCTACLCRRDCGTCDFCVDKPKFGGCNKKRQKCRLRQCQRQAMRHLLPFQFELQGDGITEPPKQPAKPKIQYTYSRKSNMKKSKGASADSHDEEEEEYSQTQPMKWSFENNEVSRQHFDINMKNSKSSMQHSPLIIRNGLSDRVPPTTIHQNPQKQPIRAETGSSHTDVCDPKQVELISDEDELPMITNVFSYADLPAANGSDLENQLMKLLHSLRASVLPIMWYAILVDGPQLQIIQCSKQSNMSDTMVLVDPGFNYQVTVQKQPLMPTHPLYDGNPALLSTVEDVVKLLLALEQFIVCRGIPAKEPSLYREAIVLERASICDFLVKKDVGVCCHCKQLQEL